MTSGKYLNYYQLCQPCFYHICQKTTEVLLFSNTTPQAQTLLKHCKTLQL